MQPAHTSRTSLFLLLTLAACGAGPDPKVAPSGHPSALPSAVPAPSVAPSASGVARPPPPPEDPFDQVVALPKTPATSQELQTFATDTNDVGIRLFRSLSKDSNLVYSPYSAATAFALVYGGAKGNTARQMRETFHTSLPTDRYHAAVSGMASHLREGATKGGYSLKVANALWGSDRLNLAPDFQTLAKGTYGAPIETLDFLGNPTGAASKVNAWAAKNTDGKIPSILSPQDFNRETVFVLANAIYFKGDWAEKFAESATKKEDFFLGQGQDKQPAWLMHNTSDRSYAEDADTQVVDLSYKDSNLSFTLVVPKSRDGLAKVESGLTPKRFADWTGALGNRKVILTMPRFKMEPPRMDLVAPLRAMGLEDVFDPRVAELDKMGKATCETPRCVLYVQKAVQKAMIEVNEKGSEAAAVTAIVGGAATTSVGPQPLPPVVVRADHPFLFFLRDRVTGVILFMGRVTAPPRA